MIRIEALLAARIFEAPNWIGDDLYYVSNLGGKLSLYRSRVQGSIPQGLLPPALALQNPELVNGYLYKPFPELGMIVLMVDRDGDEVYLPHLIPLDGGFPELLLPHVFEACRAHLAYADADLNVAYFSCESLSEPVQTLLRIDLVTNSHQEIDRSEYGMYPVGGSEDGTYMVCAQGYTAGDTVLYLWSHEGGLRRVYGTPLDERTPEMQVALTGFGPSHVVRGNRGILITTALFDDRGGLAYSPIDATDTLQPVTIAGAQHSGDGEFEYFEHLQADRYLLYYNIDGVSWLYEATFDPDRLLMQIDRALIGPPPLDNGMVKGIHYDHHHDRYALSFTSATQPTQLYTVTRGERSFDIVKRTDERVLGIAPEMLTSGEDRSYTSFDGTRISARLYRPAPQLGFTGPRPVVFYIHGGPQSQERPNFAWFSMPLIQFLTMQGIAVWVPNVRGSTGYGLSYMKQVDRDWGGKPRLDHVHALELLKDDPLIDTTRAGVVGRSYGGYMTLMLAARNPELWSAAVDMFGPYDLITFSERIPETWKPYFRLAIGDPETEADLLREHSPSTYIDQITALWSM
jgi:hypothetical protein